MKNSLPIVVSLEVHCCIKGQEKMVNIMKEEWKDALIEFPILKQEMLPTISELSNRILVKVKSDGSLDGLHGQENTEQHEKDIHDSSSDNDLHDEGVKEMEKKMQHTQISPKPPQSSKMDEALSKLGVYFSIHPFKNFDILPKYNVVYNLSENVMPRLPQARKHTSKHMLRIYPHGLRVNSSNCDPLIFWRYGAQIVSLNWQTFDLGMQMNGALFAGSKGYVVKPPMLKEGNMSMTRSDTRRILIFDLISAQGLPKEKHSLYGKIDVFTSERGKLRMKERTKSVKSSSGDVVWNQNLAFSVQDEELIFLRFRVYVENFGEDTLLGVRCVRLSYLKKGKYTSMLV